MLRPRTKIIVPQINVTVVALSGLNCCLAGEVSLRQNLVLLGKQLVPGSEGWTLRGKPFTLEGTLRMGFYMNTNRRILIDNATLSGVERITGASRTLNLNNIDNDILCLEKLVTAILFSRGCS